MRRTLLPGLCLLISSVVVAQKSKSVFFEVGGNGGLASVNFDSRLNNSDKGLGYRVGLGIIPGINLFFVATPTIWTIPVGANYLFGGPSHYLETGLGLTGYFFKGTVSTVWGINENSKGTGVLLVPNLGYRYASRKSGLQGRVFISPLINSRSAIFYWGVSIGYQM